MAERHPRSAADPGIDEFSGACARLLPSLRATFGLQQWLVTRVVGPDLVVLHAHGIPMTPTMAPGAVFCWRDSLCWRMARGLGPRISPDVIEVPAYRDAPARRELGIRAYIGEPLLDRDGRLFGTLSAMDHHPACRSLARSATLIGAQADLLAAVLRSEQRGEQAARRAERAEAASNHDVLTGLLNRRGWEAVLDAEEARAQRYGDPVAVLVVDLDDLKRVNDSAGHAAGDAVLVRAAQLIFGALRTGDVAARLGGDEFGVLAPGIDAESGAVLADRIGDLLDRNGIAASVGSAGRHPGGGLGHAWGQADSAMYAAKRARKRRSRRC